MSVNWSDNFEKAKVAFLRTFGWNLSIVGMSFRHRCRAIVLIQRILIIQTFSPPHGLFSSVREALKEAETRAQSAAQELKEARRQQSRPSRTSSSSSRCIKALPSGSNFNFENDDYGTELMLARQEAEEMRVAASLAMQELSKLRALKRGMLLVDGKERGAVKRIATRVGATLSTTA